MPILLHVDELEPGMRLLQAVQRDWQTMLPAGKVLEEWEVDSLRRRFPELMVLVGDPVLDKWAEFEDDSREQEVATTVNRQMGRLMTSVRDKLSNKTALEGTDLAGLQKAVSEVMNYINEHPVAAAILVRFGNAEDYLQEHTGNVFYTSLLIGNAIREYVYRERVRSTRAGRLSLRYGMNLTPLALGCLFHDLGMIPLEHLYAAPGPLSPQELEQVRGHPDQGVEMLPKDFDAVSKMVVRSHHENQDGTGYPRGIPSEALHVFSRVARVADALDAGTSHRVFRRAKSVARVLWEIGAGPVRSHYDPTIVRILTGLIQPFPIGAKIRLSCGRYGVVVRHNRKKPARPTIIIAFDERGRKLKRKQLESPVNLVHHEDIRLVEFGGDDLSFLYQTPDDGETVWGEPDLTPEQVEHSLFAFFYP